MNDNCGKRTKTKSKPKMIWVLVTSGKCDNRDPLFENPSPDIYASKKGAMTAMKNDAYELMRDYGWKRKGIAKQLDHMEWEMKEYDATSVDLNDSCRIEYSVWKCSVKRRVKPTYTKMVDFCKGKK